MNKLSHFRRAARTPMISVPVLLLALSACGGGGGGGSGSGTLSLNITDAPVDSADAVWIEFTGIEIKPADGSSITIDYAAPKQLNLLALTDGVSDTLLDGETLPAGQYNWIRLKVNAEEDSVYDSWIQIGGLQYELRVPSGAQTGLKLNRPFTIPEGGAASFTIDFDLRKSVHERSGNVYMLRPTLRIVDSNASGSITGTVDTSMIAAECAAGDKAAVYLFAGAGQTPDDIDGSGDPVATGSLDWEAGDYDYRIAFLEAGTYTITFTCDAGSDDPTADDAGVTFTGTTDVTVVAGQTTQHDF